MAERRTREQARIAGPRVNVYKWLEARANRISNPRRNKAAQKLAAPKPTPENGGAKL